MSLRENMCLAVDCDGCDAELWGPYLSEQDALEGSADQGWASDGEHHWCRHCQIKPHECRPDPEDRQTCARCRGPI